MIHKMKVNSSIMMLAVVSCGLRLGTILNVVEFVSKSLSPTLIIMH